MVRYIAFLALFATLSLASSVSSIANSILGFESSKSVSSILGDERGYIDENGRVDIAKISNTLKSKSLLTLSYKQKTNLDITFIGEQNSPLLLIKVVKDALNSLGYNEILTTEFTNSQNAIWGVSISTKFILDPGAFYNALKSTNTYIDAIERTGEFSYKYLIDLSKTSLNLTPVEVGKEIGLSKPLEPYFVDLKGAKRASISSHTGDYWVGLIRILDKNLNLIEEKRNSKKTNRIVLNFPQNARYLTIDDANSLENIKRGLKIYLE